jgi:hypothetical protein
MIESGVTIPTAIKQCLAKNGFASTAAFATGYELNASSTRNHLSGLVRATDDTIDALVAELRGKPDEWRELLWLAGRPTSAAIR